MNATTDATVAVDKQLYPALIQCFFIIGAGYVAGQLDLLTGAHATGLSRYVSNFALPAVIFKNLVDVQFQNVSWRFLGAVLIAKTIVFLLTMILAGVVERPRNYASMGLYPIMASQSNDFALVLPIIEAVYKQSHPEYIRYIYLIAPISLVILNPIGFVLIEIQKRLDDRHQHPDTSWHRCHLISKVFRNISRNPIVIVTLLGVIFNKILNQKLPSVVEQILTPISQSFSATALFYLGLSMVGKMRRLHAHLVVTVFLLSLIKSVVFPLVLRQAVFFVMKPSGNDSLNVTIDHSNFGFLYGTAPVAPSVVFFVPESNLALKAVASTGLVISTLLAAPIMLVSAKMIALRTLDVKTTLSYESALAKAAYDVSVLSCLCTIIVLIGFCLRRRWLKISFIHQYTFILVGLQLLHSIWTIPTYYVQEPLTEAASAVLGIGNMLIALSTRTWATSVACALMISICYSNQRARQFFWLYHLLGWIVPICATGIIYILSSADRSKTSPTLTAERFGPIQMIASIIVLSLCILISSVSLLRVARRTYQLKHNVDDNQFRRANFSINEERPLIDDEDENSIATPPWIPKPTDLIEADGQLLRHGILVALLTINAFICMAILLWSVLDESRNGVYYELQFLDTVLLHGQGIMTFLVFALDADLILPMARKFVKLLNRLGFNFPRCRDYTLTRPSENPAPLDFERTIRPDFVHHTMTRHSMATGSTPIETAFVGSELCQWLVTSGHVANRTKAEIYLDELVRNKQIVCINKGENEQTLDFSKNWYAFSK